MPILHELLLPCTCTCTRLTPQTSVAQLFLFVISFLARDVFSNGFDTVVFPRPEFYDILLSRIPSDKILFGKKVSDIKEVTRDNKVEVTCADGSKYQGDILVGADGAYSSVRQCLYKQLEIESVLPASDKRDLKCGFVTMVGTTDPLDPEKFSALKDEYSFFSQVIGTNKPYSVSIISES